MYAIGSIDRVRTLIDIAHEYNTLAPQLFVEALSYHERTSRKHNNNNTQKQWNEMARWIKFKV